MTMLQCERRTGLGVGWRRDLISRRAWILLRYAAYGWTKLHPTANVCYRGRRTNSDMNLGPSGLLRKRPLEPASGTRAR